MKFRQLSISKILILLTCLFVVFSCKKEDVTPIDEEPGTNYTSVQYNTGANVTDGLLGNISSNQTGVEVNVFGATDSNGDFLNVNSITVQRPASDTIYNFVLDEFSRIDYFFINVNGVNENRLHKITYTDNDSVYFSIHAYDWSNGVDSLIYLSGVSKIGGVYNSTTILHKNNSWIPDVALVTAGFGVGMGVVVAVGVPVVVGAAAYFLTKSAFIGAMALVVTAMQNSNAGTITDPPTSPPQSPSNTIITGLSTNTGLQGNWRFTAKWDGVTESTTIYQISNTGYSLSTNVTYDYDGQWSEVMYDASTVVKLIKLPGTEINFYTKWLDPGYPDVVTNLSLHKTGLNIYEATESAEGGIYTFLLEKI